METWRVNEMNLLLFIASTALLIAVMAVIGLVMATVFNAMLVLIGLIVEKVFKI